MTEAASKHPLAWLAAAAALAASACGQLDSALWKSDAVSPELEEQYRQLLEAAAEDEARTLAADQRRWLAHREEHCATAAQLADNDAATALADCRLAMDAERTAALTRLHRGLLLDEEPPRQAATEPQPVTGGVSEPVTIGSKASISALALLPGTRALVTAGDRHFAVHDRASGALVRAYETRASDTEFRWIKKLLPSRNGRLLLTDAIGETVLKLWDLESGANIGTVEIGHGSSDFEAILAGDDRFLVIASGRQDVVLHDLDTGPVAGGTYSLDSKALSIAADTAQRHVAIGTSQGSVVLFAQELRDGTLHLRKVAEQSPYRKWDGVHALDFSADGTSLMSVSNAGVVYRFSVPSLEQTGTAQTVLRLVTSLAATPDHAIAFVAGNDSTIRSNGGAVHAVGLADGMAKELLKSASTVSPMMALDAPSATLIVADHTDLRLLPAPMTRAALAELSAPIRTAPPPEPPPTTSYLLPEIAPNALVHAVGVYEGKYAEGVRRGFRQHPQGTVDVLVGGSQPVILVLSAYEPVKWRVQATGATRVEQILVFGNGTQEVETALRSARVYTSPQSSTSGSLVVYERTSSGYTRLAKAVRELTGKDIATFQGSYAGDTFSIDARPAAMGRDAPAIRRYVDENGVVHFEDSRLPPRDAPAPR